MATCPTCGSTLVHFENPPRDICPNPERHLVSKGGPRAGGGTGAANKGQKRPKSAGNLKKGKGGGKK